MSSDKEQEYFSDGLSEELLNLLAQVPQLRVIARTSSFSFKGKEADIAEIAEKLNVAHVLEGSVRKSGDTLRITAQLIRASDSSHLWSQTYDRPMTDVFKVQDEIAAAVVDSSRSSCLAVRRRQGRPTRRPMRSSCRPARSCGSQRGGFEQCHRALPAGARASIRPTPPRGTGLADDYSTGGLGVASLRRGHPAGARGHRRRRWRSIPEYAPGVRPARRGSRCTIEAGTWRRRRDTSSSALALEPANLDLIGAAANLARRLGRLDQAIALARVRWLPETRSTPIRSRSIWALAIATPDAWTMPSRSFAPRSELSPGYSPRRTRGSARYCCSKGDANAALAEYTSGTRQISHASARLPMAYQALGRKTESDAALDELINRYGT